jgi:hypothetical protein
MINNNFMSNTKTMVNKYLNFKTMKTNYLKKTTKFGLAALFLMAIGTANAQTTDSTDAKLNKNTEKTKVVRLVDNKGTIKYLQSSNGITSITSTAPGNQTTTTWQLGGELIDATKITTSATGTFTIDGKEVNLLDLETQADVAATTTDGTGYTILTRDEGSGRIQKLLAKDLITSGRAAQIVEKDGDAFFTATGLPVGTNIAQVSVYRNGSKLRAGVDYIVHSDDTIKLQKDTSDTNNNFTTYVDDIIEIIWINF